MGLTAADIEDLRRARALLENPGLAARISDVVGSPIERGFGMLPKSWNAAVMNATRKAIEAALDVALRTLDPERAETTSNRWHKLAVGTTGAAGGAFGLAALAIELPLSTTIMLRSIAEIARSEGEDLGSAEARLQCVQVLALGGKSGHDDAAETGYFAARAAMAKAVSEAARYAAQQGAIARGAPAIVQLITQVASRFSITVSQKVAAQAVPVVGALGGALINTLFIDHFQDMARGHFIVRRLERVHGADQVRLVYKEL
ncbi:EcsC family protein [Aromatoleum anaerobium]|uniref:EcsC family protein n=1 Tax=Aromatoleum anaerobium TaxID=182180 RepID=A0ABX1PLR9_9RHOO|nr:EcsC family protein [Aromatoleum anaerobium]MCK0506000.1 EcsC family protein [Aromatoleum anaerobium]